MDLNVPTPPAFQGSSFDRYIRLTKRGQRSTSYAEIAIAAMVCAVMTPSGGVNAQPLRDASCRSCELRLVRVTTIPSYSDGIAVYASPGIAFAGGAYVLGPTYDDGLAVWREGALRAVGRRGRGPGEFPDMLAAMEVVRAQFVYAAHSNRLSVISPAEPRVIRQIRLPWRPTGLVSIGNLFATAAPSSASTITLFDSVGDVVREIKMDVSNAAFDVLRLASSGDSALWVASTGKYRLQLVLLDGTRLRSLERTPEWFKQAGYNPGEPTRSPPAPKLVAIKELHDGLIMVLSTVADRQWKPSNPVDLKNHRLESTHDTVIEIIDVSRSEVLLTARYDDVLRFVIGSDDLWTVRENDVGDVLFEVFTPELRR